MIRRDENSRIRNELIMTDYFKQCTVYEEPIKPTDGGVERAFREHLYRQHYGNNSTGITKTQNDNMRCICWSYRFVDWQRLSDREWSTFWDDFTLEEANRQIRTRELIKILQEAKRTGNGVILFVQRVFLAEMCIKASLPLQLTDGKLCELLELSFGFIGAKAAKLCGKKYDEESQNQTIQLCRQGAVDAAVVSVKSGKNGCNLQGMNWMVSLGYIGQLTEEEQAKGTRLYSAFHLTCKGGVAEWGSFGRQGFTFYGSRVSIMTKFFVIPTSCG
jgi:hypothetical protein